MAQRTTQHPLEPSTPTDPDTRASLTGLGQAFLTSLLKRDPGLVRLAVSFRATENAQLVLPGEGLWETAEAFPALQMFADPEQGQVVYMGVAVTGGRRRPFALRLKVTVGAIVEAETIISTDPSGHFAEVDQLLKPDVLYDAPVPPERGTNRQGLLAAADSYWTALQESDGSLARFGYRCDRYDNGKKVTNTLTTLLSPDATVHTPASCVNNTRPSRPLSRERRYPVIDVARGIAASMVVVDFHPIPNSPRPDCGSFYMMGIFKVVDGEFRIIDEIREILPLGTPSGW
jgi:hypothetical protein